MATTRQILGLNLHTEAATYVGPTGSIFFDPTGTALRFGDGATPGGAPLVAGAQSVTAKLTSAQILAAAVTPVTVLPAPGVGKMIVITNILWVYRFGTVAYTTSDGGAVGIGGTLFYGPAFNINSQIGAGDDLLLLSAVSTMLTGNGNTATPLSDAANMPIIYGIDTPDIGGLPYQNGDGTLEITLFYTVISI